MNRILVAVVTCHRFRARAQLLKDTWIPDVRDADVRFFFGRGAVDEPFPDEVRLDVDDDYHSLRRKVQLVFGWAAEQGYDHVFKTDDDVYVIPERLMRDFKGVAYQGRVRGPSRENDAPRIYGPSEAAFCSGFGYWLSRHAAQIVANAPDNGDWAEDRFVGNALARAGIRGLRDPNFKLWPPTMWGDSGGHVCHRANPKCSACQLMYGQASVICPHQRPDAIPFIHRHFRESAFIPTWL